MRSIRTLFVFQDMTIVSGIAGGCYYNVVGALCFAIVYFFLVIARECLVHDYKI